MRSYFNKRPRLLFLKFFLTFSAKQCARSRPVLSHVGWKLTPEEKGLVGERVENQRRYRKSLTLLSLATGAARTIYTRRARAFGSVIRVYAPKVCLISNEILLCTEYNFSRRSVESARFQDARRISRIDLGAWTQTGHLDEWEFSRLVSGTVGR